MKFRKHFDYDVEKASDESAIRILEPSLTVQADAEGADINVLMERFGITGRIPETLRIPAYGDFSGISDYQSALNAVSDAYDSFMELPAKIRAKFDNDPQKLLEFVANDANIEEAQRLGLLKEKVNVSVGNGSGTGGGQPGTAGPSAAPGGAPAIGAT